MPKKLTRQGSPKAFPFRKHCAKLPVIVHQPAWITDLLKGFSRYVSPHMGRLTSGEKCGVADIIDPLLPTLTCLNSGINELQTLSVDRIDRISDPATLDLDARRAVT